MRVLEFRNAIFMFCCFVLQTQVLAKPIESILSAVHSQKETARADASYSDSIPQELEEFANLDRQAGPRDRVLNEMRAGLIAFEMGEYSYSLALLSDAQEQVETVYSNDPAAKKARSTFSPDATKEFKGDSYERAMLGYYLGLSYMMVGDLENARASFRWGEFQDTMSSAEEYQSDMGSLKYLQAWVDKCQGELNTASEEFIAVTKVRASLVAPIQADRALIIVEAGHGPIKVGQGKYKESLTFLRGKPSLANQILFLNRGQLNALRLAEDVYWQASTLGGRAVDKILAGKASFKQGAETAANVAGGVAQVGVAVSNQAYLSGDYKTGNAALGISAVSALFSIGAQITANKAQPAADIRYWDNLPDRVFFASTGADSMPDSVRFVDSDGVVLNSQKLIFHNTGSCYLGWVRESDTGKSSNSSSPYTSTLKSSPDEKNFSQRERVESKSSKSTAINSDVITVF